ncbi:MAG: 50S ribosomal protein L22 [Candidatus Omnitrophica bacterium]|nr:50S ribosomal protein L22 [Candidatus Omnitrophota bacterium]
MIAKAEVKFIRISPTKVRQVIDLIRLKDVASAQAILFNINKGPRGYLIKILKQAVANAKVKGFNQEQLYISKIICDVGPAWKRFKAAAFGRAAPIKKRTSHIRIELDMKSGA